MSQDFFFGDGTFDFNRVTVVSVNGQAIAMSGMGLCDPFLRGIITGLAVFKYSTGLKLYTLPAAGGDISQATAEDENIFVTGVGTVPAVGDEGPWWALAQTDTSDIAIASGNGAAAVLGFVGTMMAFEVLEPIQRFANATTVTAATNQKFHPAFLRPGFGYNERIKANLINNTAVIISYGILGSNGESRLGCIAHYGTASGPKGGSMVGNSAYVDPVFVKPFQGMILWGPRASDNLTQLNILSGQGELIGNIAAAPTTVNGPTSATDPTVIALTSGNIFQGYRCSILGYWACLPMFAWCAIPAPVTGAAGPRRGAR